MLPFWLRAPKTVHRFGGPYYDCKEIFYLQYEGGAVQFNAVNLWRVILMAKIMPGSLAGAVSGAVGNDVFSHNRYGSYIRKRVIPTKRDTVYTLAARNQLMQASRGWGALTAAQQAAWVTWAQTNPITDRLGQKQILSGNAAYVQINARMLQAGESMLDLPPVAAAPAAVATVTLTASDAAASLAFTASPLAAGLKLWVWAALTDSPSAGYVANRMKLITVSAAALVSPLDIFALLGARFGTLITGQGLIVQVQVFDSATGLLSAPVLDSTVVT